MHIRRSATPDGPLIIHDARLYRARANTGRFNHKLTEPMLKKMMWNAPILDNHCKNAPPIGRLTGWKYDPQSKWVHISGEIFDRATLGDVRYNAIRNRICAGAYKCVSISVGYDTPRGKGSLLDPTTARLKEVSVCAQGKHKKTDILTIEAAAESQIEVELSGGDITQLSMAAAPMQNQKMVEELLEAARAQGVEFSEEELKSLEAVGNDGGFAATAIIARKLADNALSHRSEYSQQQKELEELRKFKERQHAEFLEQQKPKVEQLVKRLEAAVPEASREEFKKIITTLGTSPDAKPIWGVLELMDGQMQKAQSEAGELKKTHESTVRDYKDLQRKLRQQAPAEERGRPAAVSSEKLRDASPQRRNAPQQQQNRPENLSKTGAHQQEVLIEANAESGNQHWIDRLFPDAYQSSQARAFEDEGLQNIISVMSDSNFRFNASETYVPLIGKQNPNRQMNAQPSWLRKGF